MRLAIYAIHPIMYQTPIFAALQARIQERRLPIEMRVFFGDNLSLREVYFSEISSVFRPDTPSLLTGYDYRFLPNLAQDARAGFFSRINPAIVGEIRSWQPDFVLIHGYESLTAWLALVAAKLHGAKVVWRGEALPRPHQHWLKKAIKRVAIGTFLRCCDAWLYSCSGNKSYIQEMVGRRVAKKPLLAIPCAVDNAYFGAQYNQLRTRRSELRDNLGIAPEDFCVIFCARLTERKRPRDLLRALQTLPPNFIALFVGDGPEKAHLQELAAALNVRALFTGFKNQSEVSAFYAAADAAAVISEYDPSPKAMNEAMNFALPIITTQGVGTALDLVQPNKNGFIIDIGDVSALREALATLECDRVRAEAMGRKSAQIVKAWDYDSNVDGIMDALDLLSRRAHLNAA